MDTAMLIGSRFEAGTETPEQVLNPRTGALIEAIPEASAAQIDAAKKAKRPNKAKSLVAQPLFRSRQEKPQKGKGSYRREASHNWEASFFLAA